MKYVVLSVERDGLKQEFPIIFPNELVHREVARRLTVLLLRMGSVRVVAAGGVPCTSFVLNAHRGHCHGRSESLGVASRGPIDDQLIGFRDYNAGLIDELNEAKKGGA